MIGPESQHRRVKFMVHENVPENPYRPTRMLGVWWNGKELRIGGPVCAFREGMADAVLNTVPGLFCVKDTGRYDARMPHTSRVNWICELTNRHSIWFVTQELKFWNWYGLLKQNRALRVEPVEKFRRLMR